MTQVTSAIPGHGDLASPAASTAVPTGRRSARVIARALFLLTKPRIIELLLVTTLPTMLLADRGVPSVVLVVVTLAGGALAAGSANTLNCFFDRDIDAVMKRTSRRPLVAGGGAGVGGWFLVEAHRLRGRIAAGSAPAPMRLFHLSIAYLTLLFAVIAVTAILLPFGHW